MYTIKYRCQNQFPIEQNIQEKNYHKVVFDLVTKQWDTLKSKYLLSPLYYDIKLEHEGQLITVLKNPKSISTIYLTSKGVLINLESFRIQQCINKENLYLVRFIIPEQRTFTQQQAPKTQLPPAITYHIKRQLYDQLQSGRPDKGDLVYQTTHLDQPLTVTLKVEREVPVPNEFLKIINMTEFAPIEFVNKADITGNNHTFHQRHQQTTQEIKKILLKSKTYSFSLIKKHLKKINPSAIYHVLPDLTTHTDQKIISNIVTFAQVPKKLKLLFCMYQAYKGLIKHKRLYGSKESSNVLDLAYIEIDTHLDDIAYIKTTLSGIASRTNEVTEVIERMIIKEPAKYRQDDVAELFDFLIYLDSDLEYQYIERCQNDGISQRNSVISPDTNVEWFDSRIQRNRSFSSDELERMFDHGVFYKTH